MCTAVIAGIETVRDNVDELIKHDFTILVVDEAHRVKNPKSGTTIALNRFPAQLRYGLTGTAIQNRLSEFWCILNWAVPGRVGTRRQWCVSGRSPALSSVFLYSRCEA